MSLPNKVLGLRLEFVAEVRRAVGRGQCSSQKGSGAEAESIEWVTKGSGRHTQKAKNGLTN
jgi:hypothetical protein